MLIFKVIIFPPNQYGFRSNHSTELTCLEIVDRIIQHIDNKKTPINIYLDLSKAFDTINHPILINKLNFYGINGKALDVFESYLRNRAQFVEFDNFKSDTLDISTGVPQGSVLGPLLFLIYVNDISKASKIFDFISYADDTTLSSQIHCFGDTKDNDNISNNISSELNKISEWLKSNNLSLTIKKIKFMVFHTPQKKFFKTKHNYR